MGCNIIFNILLFDPLNFRKLKGVVDDRIPANSSFDDAELYGCVVSSYIYKLMDENPMEAFPLFYDEYENSYDIIPDVEDIKGGYEAYKIKLTDEQINTVDSLMCNNVSSTKGIEKLTKLRRLTLGGDYKTLDISKNEALTSLQLSSSSLKEIDLTNNKYISSIYLYAGIEKLDVSALNSLRGLYVSNDKISEITVSFSNFSNLNIPSSVKKINIVNGAFEASVTLKSDKLSLHGNELVSTDSSLTLEDIVQDINSSNPKYLELKNLTVEANNGILSFSAGAGDKINKQFVYFDNSIFEDYNLYKKITSQLGKDFTVSALSNITSLECDDCYSLKGIEKLTNLQNLSISSTITELDLSNNHNIVNLSLSGAWIDELDLYNLSNLRNLSLLYTDIKKLYVNHNNNLKGLTLLYNDKLEEIVGLNDIQIEELMLLSAGLKKVDIGGNKAITSLMISSLMLGELDLSEASNLQIVYVASPKLKSIKGVENLNLQIAYFPYSKIEKMDLTKSTNLMALNTSFSEVSKTKINMLVGEKLPLEENLKINQEMIANVSNEDIRVATYDKVKNEIKGLKYGQTTITKYYETMDLLMTSNMTYLPLKTYVNVFDIKSSKYEVNKELGYIYVGTEDNDKAIKRYVKVYGEEVSKKLEDNKFTILSNNEKVREFDVIKVSSSKYDMNSNEIIYSGEFDISKIKITNAKLEVIEDELQINYKGNVIRTFKLTKEEK